MATPTGLDPAARPATILCRDREQTALDTATTALQHLHVHGPRGTGKTLLVQDLLTRRSTAYYLSGRRHNTQYKALAALHQRITGDDLPTGYHTAQLQHRVAQHLRDTPTLLVLDDLAFLLANDGNDLLYFLSRLDHPDLGIVGITAGQSPLATILDDRTYSSLQPRQLPFPPYTADETVDILKQRVTAAPALDTVPGAVLEHVAATTTNLTLALHWLACAALETENPTVDVLQTVAPDAVHRYRDSQLDTFSRHHTVLLAAIDETTADTATVTTGTIYTRYKQRCADHGLTPLTARRIGDYLTHLELLHLIDVTHHRGGPQGKTREIRPTPLQEL